MIPEDAIPPIIWTSAVEKCTGCWPPWKILRNIRQSQTHPDQPFNTSETDTRDQILFQSYIIHYKNKHNFCVQRILPRAARNFHDTRYKMCKEWDDKIILLSASSSKGNRNLQQSSAIRELQPEVYRNGKEEHNDEDGGADAVVIWSRI